MHQSAGLGILGIELPVKLVTQVGHDGVALIQDEAVLFQARHRSDDALGHELLAPRVLPRHRLHFLHLETLIEASPGEGPAGLGDGHGVDLHGERVSLLRLGLL